MVFLGVVLLLLLVSFLLSLHSLKKMRATREAKKVSEELKAGRVIFHDSSSSDEE